MQNYYLIILLAHMVVYPGYYRFSGLLTFYSMLYEVAALPDLAHVTV